MNWIERLIALLEKIPAIVLGYKLGREADKQLENDNTNLELKVKELENEKRIKDHNANLSDDDLKSEILGRRPGDGTDSTD